MIQAIKENKKSIIIALIIAITVFYMQPLLTFIGTQIVNLFVSMSNKFSNYFFQLVAENDPNLISNYIASLIVLVFWWVGMDVFMKPWEAIKDAEKKVIRFERQIKGSETDLKKEEINIESEIAELKAMLRKRKVRSKFIIILSVLIFFYFSFKHGIYSEVNLENVSFQNRLTVLAAHLSDNETKQLRAKWVQMKSANDYKQIKNAIAGYYKKYNLNE